MKRGWVLLLAGGVLAAGLFGAWRLQVVREAEREAAVETSRVRAWARTEGGAGVSVLPKRVPAADPGEIEALSELPGYMAFAERCASCHALPDPAAYPAKRWIGKVDEMREHIRRAGLLPPPAEELAGAIEFLQAASDSLRP